MADDEAARDAVDSALEEIERLETLALNLLVLARMRAAGPPPEQRVDLRVVSEQAVAGLLRARDAGRVDLDISGNASTIGDASALERAVGNLVENALRHADHSVRVELSEVSAAAIVEVSDDGPGFPSTVVDRAGQRFVPGRYPRRPARADRAFRWEWRRGRDPASAPRSCADESVGALTNHSPFSLLS